MTRSPQSVWSKTLRIHGDKYYAFSMYFLFKPSIFALLILSTHSLVWAEAFYPTSFEESRQHFVQQAHQLEKKYKGVQIVKIPISNKHGDDLSIDAVYVPQIGGQRERLVIITSGTHGIEAFTGAAIQSQFMESGFDMGSLHNMGFLIVHSMNPWGFHHKRRVTENNVDLNRNFSLDNKLFETQNPGYTKLNTFLNPLDPVNATLFSEVGLFIKSLWLLVTMGRATLAQAVVGGQYKYPKGVYFGGGKHEPQVPLFQNLLKRFAHSYKSVFHIDLHTGYGERGRLHFFSSNRFSDVVKSRIQQIFQGFTIDTGDDKDFYENSGGFTQHTVSFFTDKLVIPMVFEFGTLDSQTTMGGFASLRNSIWENQGYLYGYVDEFSKKKVLEDYSEMFNPTDPTWREKALKTAKESFATFLDRFGKMSTTPGQN
ncbi:MAG: DUF2817 domain-containing protein [Bdellovibrionales bacterium]|nr:DUF2817 domain-containing protein [Bdellovibrionales bacterium]